MDQIERYKGCLQGLAAGDGGSVWGMTCLLTLIVERPNLKDGK